MKTNSHSEHDLLCNGVAFKDGALIHCQKPGIYPIQHYIEDEDGNSDVIEEMLCMEHLPANDRRKLKAFNALIHE